MKHAREAWRRAPRRRRQAIMVALVLALPGGITAGASAGMRPPDADRTPAVLEGILAGEQDAAIGSFLEPEHLEAVPVGASNVAEPVRAVLDGEEVIEILGENGIPSVAVDAYMQAADRLAVDDPECGIRWTLLAAIGRVESNHGRFGGAQLRDDGYGTERIRGLPLDGRPDVALIRDTDAGRLDGDTTYDRAVGPMQFIPSTWQSVGVDADGDGSRDPNNIFDAAQGAAVYLCRGDADLRDAGARGEAVRRYNNAERYVRVVLDLADMYESGGVDLLPSIGLPPRQPSPPPRSTPAPPRTTPDPEMPLGADRSVAPAPAPEAPAQPLPPPRDAPAPVPPTAGPARPPVPPNPGSGPTTPPPAPATTAPAPPPASPPTSVAPAPATTVPTPPPTVPVPPPTTPTVPVPPPTDPGVTEPPAEPPAAVGWAPAMREVVVEIIEEADADPGPGPDVTEPALTPARPPNTPPPADPPPAPDAPTGVCPPVDAEAGSGCPAGPSAVPVAPAGGASPGADRPPAGT